MRKLGLFVLFFAGACVGPDAEPQGGAVGGGGGKADDGVAAITFGDDWSETVDGTVRAGRALQIRYDADRLPGCRGEQAGVPQWAITAYASIDGGAATVVPLAGEGVLEGAIADVPPGAELAMWFSVSNRWGCIAWDSDFGHDYRFAIDPATGAAATVRIDRDGVTLDGALVAGGTVTIEYDPARETTCRGTQGGRPQWSVTGYASVDGAPATTFDPTAVEGAERVTDPTTLPVPDGDELALWFQHTNRWGCVAWDSDFGANFVFAIER